MNKLQNVNIKYGNDAVGEASDSAKYCFKYLQEDTADLKTRYIALGFHLNEFCNNKYYREFGYENIYDFCDENIGLDKSAVSRCMNVWFRFAKRQIESNVVTMFLDDKYADFNYTQLIEMLPLNEEQVKKITPDMTCKQIREYKKKMKELKVKSKEESSDFIDFEKMLEDGDFMIEIVGFMEKYFKKHGKELRGLSYTNKQIFFKNDEQKYKLTLSVLKK